MGSSVRCSGGVTTASTGSAGGGTGRVPRGAGLGKRAGCRSCATHLLEGGYDLRTTQELLGHRDLSTTTQDTRVLNRGGLGVRSPLDSFLGPPSPQPGAPTRPPATSPPRATGGMHY